MDPQSHSPQGHYHPEGITAIERRVLVVAPTGRDSSLICSLLQRAQLPCEACSSDDLLVAVQSGAGALILADEVLTVQTVERLALMLRQQPSWSDLPLILLTAAGRVTSATLHRTNLREPLGNVLLLERPVRPETLLSTVKNAVRSRLRQYEVRDYVRRQTEAEEALRRTEKLAVAGRLAATIAHEINNPLEAVTNIVWLLQNHTDLPKVAQQHLRIVQEELARVALITKQTLGFYHDSVRVESIRVSDLIENVLAVFAARLRNKDVEVRRDMDPSSTIQGRPGELRQVFANLIANSIDAVRQHGIIHIRVNSARHEKRDGVRILFVDNGSGIPRENVSRIFEAFFSTKGSVGTGLGLWVVKDLVTKHGGSVQVRSRRNAHDGWTVFSLFLPADNERSRSGSASGL